MRFPSLITLVTVFLLVQDIDDCQKKKRPNINGWHTNYGDVKQVGENVFLAGHDNWEAEGFFRKDGKLALTWICLYNELLAVGLYELKDGALWGQWGFEDEAKFVPDMRTGKLEGTLSYPHLIHQVPDYRDQP